MQALALIIWSNAQAESIDVCLARTIFRARPEWLRSRVSFAGTIGVCCHWPGHFCGRIRFTRAIISPWHKARIEYCPAKRCGNEQFCECYHIQLFTTQP